MIIAPALAVKVASDRGGMGDTEGLDLLIASAILGGAHALVAWSRLRSEERTAIRRADMWIAAFDSLVVLAFGATLLLVAILYGFADEHASLVDRGYPVVVLWVGVQLIAIAAAAVRPNDDMKRPTIPPMNPTGRNTAINESVVAMTARPISFVPSMAA